LALLVLVAGLGLQAARDTAATGGGNSITTPDTGIGNIAYASLVLDASGNPVVSYYDQAHGDLKVLHCDDPNCAGNESGDIATPDTNPAGSGHDGSDQGVGLYTSLRLDTSGNPVVAYHDHDNGHLKLLHCDDPNCAGNESGDITTPDTGSNHPGSYASLVLDTAGRPVVSYRDGILYELPPAPPGTPGDGDLKVMHCNDINCAGSNESIVTVDANNDLANNQTSIALDSAGNPVVSYSQDILSTPSHSLKVLHCDDPNCTGGGEAIRIPVTSVGSILFSSLKLDATGKPVVSYFSASAATGGNALSLWVLHCDDALCDGTESPQVAQESPAGTNYFQGKGYLSSLVLDSNGFPVIAHSEYRNFTPFGTEVYVTRCLNADCSAGSVVSVVAKSWAPAGPVWNWSLALDSNNRPVVAFQTVDEGSLGIVHCVDANCNADKDGDGCPDAKEEQSESGSQLSGGLRDPSNEWDYFNPTHDGLNRVDDILAVVNAYFMNGETATDRTLPTGAPNAWNLGPPNGQVRIDDVLNIVKQYFHDCGPA
jgi:hypothetical protein